MTGIADKIKNKSRGKIFPRKEYRNGKIHFIFMIEKYKMA